MKLQEIFDALQYGEFTQLSIGGQPAGTVNEKNWPAILPHLNLGLSALFTRFNLKTGRVIVQLQPNQTDYNLTSFYSQNSRNGRAPVKYIVDSITAPFNDDILKIEKVYNDENQELDFNKPTNIWSIQMPMMNTIRVPTAMVVDGLEIPERYDTALLAVEYRAAHSKISIPIGFFDPARVDMELPYSHLEALLYFIGARVQMPVGMTQEMQFSNVYFAKYEAACQALENRGIQIDTGEQDVTRARRNGWC